MKIQNKRKLMKYLKTIVFGTGLIASSFTVLGQKYKLCTIDHDHTCLHYFSNTAPLPFNEFGFEYIRDYVTNRERAIAIQFVLLNAARRYHFDWVEKNRPEHPYRAQDLGIGMLGVVSYVDCTRITRPIAQVIDHIIRVNARRFGFRWVMQDEALHQDFGTATAAMGLDFNDIEGNPYDDIRALGVEPNLLDLLEANTYIRYYINTPELARRVGYVIASRARALGFEWEEKNPGLTAPSLGAPGLETLLGMCIQFREHALSMDKALKSASAIHGFDWTEQD